MIEQLFFILIIIYTLQSIIYFLGIKKKFPRIPYEDFPTATIIVAARNEENNILRTLHSLDKLKYPEGKLEIIIVDDNSTDLTGHLINEFIKDKPIFKKISTSGQKKYNLVGKTNALAIALDVAKGEVILTTDADIIVKPSWAMTIASHYHKSVAIVNGFTSQEPSSLWGGIQAIDFMYLQTVASSTINLGLPVSCIGNNMSFLKKAYEEVGGYENLPFSVTEDLNLMMAIHSLKKYKIIYPLNTDAMNLSLPCPDLLSLIRQKKRWGKGGLQVFWRGSFVFFVGYLSNFFILLTPFFYSPIWLFLLISKLLMDILILWPTHKEFSIKKNLKYFLFFEIYFIIYVLILPFIVLPSRKTLWKGRKY